MSHTLTVGLTDLSRELGETTVQTGPTRIRAYNDAIIDFANEKKWPFLVKESVALATQVGVKTYSLTGISDMRFPGPVKEIYLGDDTTPYTPIEWADRNNADIEDGKHFYLNPDETSLTFKGDITAVKTIHLWYYYIPARIEDTNSSSLFPIPDRYRKVVATLAAAYVQWSRYLDAQGNRLYNFYEKMVGKVKDQQSERNAKSPMKLPHYLKFRGFRRTYPGR